MEIYNEKLRDLFDCDLQKSINSINGIGNANGQFNSKQLKIREHPTKGNKMRWKEKNEINFDWL